MYFRDIVGQSFAKEELTRSFSQGIVPHARLFVGADGMGALALAYAYARYINCQATGSNDACGQCSSCKRYDEFAAQDLLFLFPIVNQGSSNLCDDELPLWREYLALGAHTTYSDWQRLEQADNKRLSIYSREGRVLAEKLSYHIAEARYRVLLIWLPEKMQDVLANKLLKLTEEPPERTIILMVSIDEMQILGTLRSRMQTLRLRPANEGEIVKALRSLPSSSTLGAELAAHLSLGNYAEALRYYTEGREQTSTRTQYLKRILRATVNAQPIEMRTLVDEIVSSLGREEQTGLLEYTIRMFREFYLYNLQLPAINYLEPGEEEIARYIANCITGKNIRIVQEEISLALIHLEQNVNARMVFMDLLLRLTSTLIPSYRAKGLA